jgi:hypothetical protein
MIETESNILFEKTIGEFDFTKVTGGLAGAIFSVFVQEIKQMKDKINRARLNIGLM